MTRALFYGSSCELCRASFLRQGYLHTGGKKREKSLCEKSKLLVKIERSISSLSRTGKSLIAFCTGDYLDFLALGIILEDIFATGVSLYLVYL